MLKAYWANVKLSPLIVWSCYSTHVHFPHLSQSLPATEVTFSAENFVGTFRGGGWELLEQKEALHSRQKFSIELKNKIQLKRHIRKLGLKGEERFFPLLLIKEKEWTFSFSLILFCGG